MVNAGVIIGQVPTLLALRFFQEAVRVPRRKRRVKKKKKVRKKKVRKKRRKK